jgi:hypothetical protein
MRRITRLTALAVVGAGAVLLVAGWSQPPAADQPSPALPEPAAPLTAATFMHGTWVARVGDDTLEEQWGRPAGSSLFGSFRWIKADGTVRLYELLTITAEEDGPIFRFRHFSPELVPWEPKDEPITLRLVESGENKLVFENVKAEASPRRMIYELTEPGKLGVTLIGVDGDRTNFGFLRDPE